MRTQLNPVIIAVALVVLVGALAYAGWYYASPHTPAGVKYTPGVPPWLDKSGNAPKVPGQPSGPGGPPVISAGGQVGRK